MKKNIIIIVLCVLLLGLSGYVLYDKILSDSKPSIDKLKNNEPAIEIKEYSKEDFDKIVDDGLGLSVLLNKKSLDEMTNQERLRMIISLYTGEDKYETFSQARLEKIHSDSVIKNLPITYESLSDYYGTFLWNTNLVGYEYNNEDKTFKYTGALGHGGSSRANISYKEMISMDTDGTTYTVKYRYVFYNSYGEGPSDVTLYLNVEDALNSKNELVKLTYDYENDTYHDKEYVEEHYDEIKDKLPVYTYVFKVEDNRLVITDFSVESK